MTLNASIHYRDGILMVDSISTIDLAQLGTPVYVYSLRRALHNYHAIKTAYAGMRAHVHFSAKANANLAVLKTLIDAGAGVDCVSWGEVYKAMHAGAQPDNIVFAGVGKTHREIAQALQQEIGWFNVESVGELELINRLAGEQNKRPQVALRLNPDVTANTHPNIATGHGAAKFGMPAEEIAQVLAKRGDYSHLNIAGVHIHIGSQLGDVQATTQAVRIVLDLIAPHPEIRTLNIGGGMPARYTRDADLPDFAEFAQALRPLLDGYTVILEPGRSIIADAGVLLTEVLYIKAQGGQRFVIVDASMTEIMRPALYGAHHEIVPLVQKEAELAPAQVVGPVCETTDVLGRDVLLPPLQAGDQLAILTAGAYGMVMANNYNMRPRPAEIVVSADGETHHVARQRETLADLLRGEAMP